MFSKKSNMLLLLLLILILKTFLFGINQPQRIVSLAYLRFRNILLTYLLI